MREAARVSAAKSRQALQPTSKNLTRALKRVKTDESDVSIKAEQFSPDEPCTTSTRDAKARKKPSKTEDGAGSATSISADLQAKKLKAYSQYANQSPFPAFPHPTVAEAQRAHRILTHLHGVRNRPEEVVAPTTRAGCGDSSSVLDALVRTILSQNTSNVNSTRAKLSMDEAYGSSDKWDSIVDGGQAKLQEAIKCGGLSAVKSKVILNILRQVKEKYGKYSLDHLHNASSEDAMTEMLSFQGVGPKTASCVLLFCLKRESFAVDTHVWRITGLLGWRPKEASRDETYAHLDVRIPDEDKYGLHILLVTHGRQCEECKAGGKALGKCELRMAFRKGKVDGQTGEKAGEEAREETGEEAKEEEIEQRDEIKKEKGQGLKSAESKKRKR